MGLDLADVLAVAASVQSACVPRIVRAVDVIGDADVPKKKKKKKKGDEEPAGPPSTALEMAGGAH